MSLEVGKRYKRRDGQEVLIVEKRKGFSFPFRCNNGSDYTSDGKFQLLVNYPSQYDLIEEVMTESKFKVGDKVYSILLGIGSVTETMESREYSIEVIFEAFGMVHYTLDGKEMSQHVNPTLLTLEEARAKGYDVPKQKVTKTAKRWALVYLDGTVGRAYTSYEDACRDATLYGVQVVEFNGTYEVEE